MNKEKDTMIRDLIDQLSSFSHIRPGDVPNIDLYMDQVTSFMDSRLKGAKRNEKDKILTKTMINNYTKNKLLPPPEKKRYSKEHMLMLVFIYYLKGFLSLDDIQSVLHPLAERFFHADDLPDIQAIYTEVYSLGKEHVETIQEQLRASYQQSSQTFEDAPEEEKEFLQIFSFICLLSYDIYLRKHMIEELIDQVLS